LATLALKIDRVRGKLSDLYKQELWDQFVENNVHELRRELNVGRGRTDTLRTRHKSGAELLSASTLEMLDVLRDSYERAFRAIERVRDYVRPMGKFTEDDLGRLISEAIGQDDKIRFVPPDSPIPMAAASDALIGVVRELVANAREAAEAKEVPLRVEISVSESADTTGQKWAKLEVEDRSGGISLKIRQDVERRYVSTKKNRNSGLGLAIIRKTVDRHGGQFRIEDIDNGTRIVVTVPMVRGKGDNTNAKRASG